MTLAIVASLRVPSTQCQVVTIPTPLCPESQQAHLHLTPKRTIAPLVMCGRAVTILDIANGLPQLSHDPSHQRRSHRTLETVPASPRVPRLLTFNKLPARGPLYPRGQAGSPMPCPSPPIHMSKRGRLPLLGLWVMTGGQPLSHKLCSASYCNHGTFLDMYDHVRAAAWFPPSNCSWGVLGARPLLLRRDALGLFFS